jgi:hypothetical protein
VTCQVVLKVKRCTGVKILKVSNSDLLCPAHSRFQLRCAQIKSWLPRNPMKLDKAALPDLQDTDCYTAPFTRARMHQ